MRKEIIFAVISGGLLGIIIAFGVWRANSALKVSESARVEDVKENQEESFLISLVKPEDNQVFTQDSVLFSGATSANTYLVISGETQDYLLVTDENGVFEQEVELTSGVNQIILTAVKEDGAKSVKKIIAVYSSQFKERENE